MVATVPVVTFGVGRINLVIVGRTGGQTGKRHLVARDHRRINWRTSSVGNGGSVIDRGVGRDVCCPKDLRARGCDRPGLYVRNVQSRRGGRSSIGAANQARAAAQERCSRTQHHRTYRTHPSSCAGFHFSHFLRAWVSSLAGTGVGGPRKWLLCPGRTPCKE